MYLVLNLVDTFYHTELITHNRIFKKLSHYKRCKTYLSDYRMSNIKSWKINLILPLKKKPISTFFLIWLNSKYFSYIYSHIFFTVIASHYITFALHFVLKNIWLQYIIHSSRSNLIWSAINEYDIFATF